MITGINIFENRKAMQLFVECSNGLGEIARVLFTKKVQELFDQKTVSEDGEFDSFKITEKDVARIYDNLLK